jgi:hypothetical protein
VVAACLACTRGCDDGAQTDDQQGEAVARGGGSMKNLYHFTKIENVVAIKRKGRCRPSLSTA